MNYSNYCKSEELFDGKQGANIFKTIFSTEGTQDLFK